MTLPPLGLQGSAFCSVKDSRPTSTVSVTHSYRCEMTRSTGLNYPHPSALTTLILVLVLVLVIDVTLA